MGIRTTTITLLKVSIGDNHYRGVVVNTPDLRLTRDSGSIPGRSWWLLWCRP